MNTEDRLARYEALYGHILFPAEPGTDDWRIRREIAVNPAGRWAYSFDGRVWSLLPMDTGKLDFPRALLLRLPDRVHIGMTQAVRNNPDQYAYSIDQGHSWNDLDRSMHWIYHGSFPHMWFLRKEKTSAISE